MIDTHAHVHDPQFDDDRAATLARARAAGVETIVTIGCDLADSARAIRTAETYGLLATIGIHPHEAAGAPADIATAFDELRAQARAPIVAIGETGLDFHYDHSPHEDQRRVLRGQIAYARGAELPVVFHQREAYDDFVGILRDTWDRATMRGVTHCFTGDAAQARTLVDEFGLLLGIGGVVTFKTAQPLRDAVRAVGLGAIVMETDCPYLAPVPHRGRRNEPAFVMATARAVADLLEIPVEDLIASTTANARRLFALPAL
jgi:TatD DNase family protein